LEYELDGQCDELFACLGFCLRGGREGAKSHCNGGSSCLHLQRSARLISLEEKDSLQFGTLIK
jgi:hypothetical protein